MKSNKFALTVQGIGLLFMLPGVIILFGLVFNYKYNADQVLGAILLGMIGFFLELIGSELYG